jgi:hypothetical protein
MVQESDHGHLLSLRPTRAAIDKQGKRARTRTHPMNHGRFTFIALLGAVDFPAFKHS